MAGQGLNRFKRLQTDGIAIKEGRLAKLALHEITIPTDGPLAHPRLHREVTQDLIDDIAKRGIQKPLRVKETTGKGGKIVFLLVAGSRRLRAGLKAEKILEAEGRLPEGGLFAPVEFFEGNEVEFLLARQEEDGDPLKLPHTPGEIAATFVQVLLLDPEIEIRRLLATCPPNAGYTDRVVEALTRWPSLPKEVQDAFDNGIEIEGSIRPVSIGLLPGMDKFANEDKIEALRELVAGGYKTFSGVTKYVNAKEFEKQIAADDREPEATDKTDETDADDKPGPKARASKNGTNHDSAGSFMVRKSACQKAYDYAVANKAPANVIAFAAGALFLQGGEIDTVGFPERLLAFVDGGCWQRGVSVKVPAEIKAALAPVTKEPKQGTVKRRKKGEASAGKAKTKVKRKKAEKTEDATA